ncbi:MAG: type IIL restriction-modification enzyme MmeI [Pseudonocardiaceae bacterium]
MSIIGFDRLLTPKPVLWTYSRGGQGTGEAHVSSRINPYLVSDAPIVLVSSSTNPIGSSLPPVDYGNKPTDGGHLFVDLGDLDKVQAEDVASQYLRRFVRAKELLRNLERWCLWLERATHSEIKSSAELRTRTAAVRQMRNESTKPATRRRAAIPHLFDERRQPSTSYLAIPEHAGEHRRYFTAARLDSTVICGNANFMAPDPDGLVLGILSSTMFIEWMRAIGGRIKSDLRFSNTFVYNSFPLPTLTDLQREALICAATEIIRTRGKYPAWSLAALYEPGDTPTDLLQAHLQVDRVVDMVFGAHPDMTSDDRQCLLFRWHAAATGQETLEFD